MLFVQSYKNFPNNQCNFYNLLIYINFNTLKLGNISNAIALQPLVLGRPAILQ